MNATQRNVNEQWLTKVKEMTKVGGFFFWKDEGHVYRVEERDGTRVFVPTNERAFNDIVAVVGTAWAKVNVVRV